MNNGRLTNPEGMGHQHGHYEGDPQLEVLQRLRRLETRVMNTSRAMGMLPGMQHPDPLKAQVMFHEGKLYVTSSDVSLGDILATGVLNCQSQTCVLPVVMHNQVVASVMIHGHGGVPGARSEL